MENSDVVEQLAAGFETLQEEYQKLFGQHQSLERKLATARHQYNELAKLCGTGAIATPPLSLSSSPEIVDEPDVTASIERRKESGSGDAARRVRAAVEAARVLRQSLQKSTTAGVRIWSGPVADRPEPACSMMPSVSESPLEQDFTIEGKPSKLGCPFASMANKKLSSHAASVLSRYNTQDSTGGVPSTSLSSASQVNGKESLSRRGSRRTSFADPIKAEICRLSDHHQHDNEEEVEHEREQPNLKQHVAAVGEDAEIGVCPIRFMDQHSPEEVATYFEKHKHELPRSHEVCVRRYQSNEEQIRQLDAKYGNLVSMIQGLGAKHKELLPHEPADLEDDEANEHAEMDKKGGEKVRRWASSVSAQAVNGHEAAIEDEEDRRSRIDRPMRDIRVGESPSRPWGISVPAKYLETAGSEGSSWPAQIGLPAPVPAVAPASEVQSTRAKGKAGRALAAAARCPFGFDQKGAAPADVLTETAPKAVPEARQAAQLDEQQQAAFVASPTSSRANPDPDQLQRMLFTGPVFIGYSAEDAAKILWESGLGGR